MNTLRAYMTRNRVTQRQLADLLGVTQGLIYQWLSGIRKVSAKRVLSVCEVTRWEVTPHELRPDIYPNPTDGLPTDQPPVMIASDAIKSIEAVGYTRLSGGGCLYSVTEQERRHEERRQAERRERERREAERRHAS